MNTISATTAATPSGAACGVLPGTLLGAAHGSHSLLLTCPSPTQTVSVSGVSSSLLSTHVHKAGCAALCRLAGHLKLCSASLYFVPRNVEEPILRIPFRATTSIVRCHIEVQRAKECQCTGEAVLQHCLL